MNANVPATLNDTENLVLWAVRSCRYSLGNKISRPFGDLTYTWKSRDREFSAFQGYGDMAQPLEWATLVAATLCEDRITLPTRPAKVITWEEVIAEVRRLVTEKFEADKVEFQAELDEEPEEFAKYHSSGVKIVDGKVTDPWGPALSGPVFWWLDNATLVATWLVYQTFQDAAHDAVQESLASWTLSDREGTNVGKLVHERFGEAMNILDRDIRDLLAA